MDFVFLHGGGQGGWVWEQTVAAMALQAPGRHRTLVLDVPGCGTRRGRDTSAIAFPELVDELLADIARADLRDVVVVGHSMAGVVLPALIAARPDLFARAIHVSCVAPAPGSSVLDAAMAIHANPRAPLHGIFGNPEVPMREQFFRAFCNDMGPVQAEAFLDRLSQDHWPESASVYADWAYDHLAALPSTYVHCLEDTILPPWEQEVFAARLHCERTVRIAAGHQVMVTRPQGLAELLMLEAEPPA
ncbi:alpha/beta fold hydrolase [Novosphingobium bradum]|uniref:Alpha/beta fold hydrolase n=1 Tax=Novosphingobium bradum TaxID=1737444 RepID=A0ABV7IN87_9SPHN